MDTLAPHSLTEALSWRYATKKFDPSRTIPEETWSALEKSLVLTPSSLGLQPWKFIIVRDPATRAKLAAAAWNQTQPVDCSHFDVFAGLKGLGEGHVDRFLKRIAEVRGVTIESLKGYRDMIMSSVSRGAAEGTLDEWQARQSYIALGQFMAAAEVLGVDTCPMEGLDPKQFDEILGLEGTPYYTLVACAAGYRAPGDKYATMAKVRFADAEVVRYV